MSKISKRFDESVKRYAVSQLETGRYSLSDVAREVGACKQSVWKWVKEYGRYRPQPPVVEVIMSSAKEEIERLKQALADSHLKNVFYEELIKQAGKHYKTDLKKTFGTSPSESSKAKGGGLKSSAKR
jgi:transposase-like protein